MSLLFSGATARLRSAFATLGGSALVGWIQAGAGAVARLLQDKAREVVSAEDFGADKTGAAFCDAAFSALKTYAQASGAEIVFTAGTYKHAQPFTVNWSRARVAFRGKVTFVYTGAGNAVEIDGGASGSLYDVRFGESGGPLIRADAGANGVYVRSLGHGVVNAEVLSCTVAGLKVEYAVCVEFGVRCTKNAQPGGAWVSSVPVNGMILNKRGATEGVADCLFRNCIVEGVSGDGVKGDYIHHCTFIGGTSEGNGGGGYLETGASSYNTLSQFFCEANGGPDYALAGEGTVIDNGAADSTAAACTISGNRNVLRGGNFAKLNIQATAMGTVLSETYISAAIAGGAFTDAGVKTVYQNVKWATNNGSIDVPDVARRPKIKRVGQMSITGATQAARCVVTIPNHRLDFGESIAVAAVGGMVALNGNTYQVEPIADSDSLYLMSGGAYVNSLGFGAYTAGGTATFVAFNSTWAAAGGNYREPGFSKDQNGLVKLAGSIKGTGLAGVAAFTLPPGFRPAALLTFPAWELTPSPAIVQINAAGVVTPSTYTDGANKVVSLDGIAFFAE